VGVQVDGRVEALAQRPDQRARGGRAQQARHVLDREHVDPGCHECFGEAQVRSSV